MVIRKIRKYVLSSVLFALSRFMTIQVNQEEDDANERRLQKEKKERAENKKKVAGWLVQCCHVTGSGLFPTLQLHLRWETCTRSPLFPSSGFIRLAMGIKFRPL